MMDLKISAEPLNVSACIEKVMDPECGGTDIFIGSTRNKTDGRSVLRLEYEAYESMALKEMRKIAEEAAKLWKIQHILIHHRTGILQVRDIAVIVAASALHRNEAFDACRYAIDIVKKTVPIWKKEVFEDGEEWVSCTCSH
jgi:molybdopterin synthase catalytic subunit